MAHEGDGVWATVHANTGAIRYKCGVGWVKQGCDNERA